MPNPTAINTAVTITSKSLTGTSVAKTFTEVLEIHFDFFMGKLQIRDASQGVSNYGLTEVTTLTYTVAGTATTIVIT